MTQQEFETADYMIVRGTVLRNLKREIQRAKDWRDCENLVNLLWMSDEAQPLPEDYQG